MDRETVLERLCAHEAELRAMGVLSLSLFGSVTRGEAAPGSDVDVGVELDHARRLDLLDFAAINLRLSDMRGAKVDLVSEPAQGMVRARDRAGPRPCLLAARRLRDIIENIDNAISYVGACDHAAFAAEQMRVDAVESCIERMAEAMIKIGVDRMKTITPEIALPGTRSSATSCAMSTATSTAEAAGCVRTGVEAGA